VIFDQAGFRALFPALGDTVWLDTPAMAPLAAPVHERLSEALAAWSSGDIDWLEWDTAMDRVRMSTARWLGIDSARVATVGSAAEGAAAVTQRLPPGRVVVGDTEFRSNLLPYLALDPQYHDVVRVPARDGHLHGADLAAAVDAGTVLLAVSDVLSCDGVRQDLASLREATAAVGARLLVDSTQSLGVLPAALDADYVVAHAYKWMLAPRGAAFLIARHDRVSELLPSHPSWKTGRREGFFGGAADLAPDASRADTSPAWLSWLGAEAAIDILRRLDASDVQAHCLALAQSAAAALEELGYAVRSRHAQGSHIVAVDVTDAERTRNALQAHRIRAAVTDTYARFGFHYFTTSEDVDRLLEAMPDPRTRAKPRG
jgi:selenocysteine lyase/cysteine desulfurase